MVHQERKKRRTKYVKLAQLKSNEYVTKPSTIKLFNTLHTNTVVSSRTTQHILEQLTDDTVAATPFTVVVGKNRFETFVVVAAVGFALPFDQRRKNCDTQLQ